MKLKNIMIFIVLSLLSYRVMATDNIDFTKYFSGTYGSCFILFDEDSDKIEHIYETGNHCHKTFPPAVNFSLVLSLIAYDSGLAYDPTIFYWDGRKFKNKAWNHHQYPASWIKNNVLWVSENIANKLGEEKMAQYLAKFRYGNQDITSGVSKFWHSGASLKISSYQQLEFMKAFSKFTLPVKIEAIEQTRELFLQGIGRNNQKLTGKAGAGEITDHNYLNYKYGWFVGELNKQGHKYIIITNIQAPEYYFGSECPGCKARETTKTILTDLGIY